MRSINKFRTLFAVLETCSFPKLLSLFAFSLLVATSGFGGDIFKTGIKGVEIRSLSLDGAIIGFSVEGDSLIAHLSSGLKSAIIWNRVGPGVILRAFKPSGTGTGRFIVSFTASGPDANGWVSLIAHSHDGQQDTILKTQWTGTWVQGYSPGFNQTIDGFIAAFSGSSVILTATKSSISTLVLTGTLDKTVDHGITATDTFTVTNDGNEDIDSIVFEVTNLVDGAGRFIASSYITFSPTFIDTLGIGLSQDVEVFVAVPFGTYDTIYTGMVTVKDDDGFPLEMIAISITVNPSYDLDIDDNGQDLVGDTMSLVGDMDSVVAGNFLLLNPNSDAQNVDPDSFGNANLDLSAANAYIATDLILGTDTIPSDSIIFLVAPSTLASGDSANIGVSVSIPGGQQPGTYTGTVTVTSADGSTDNFTLNVTVNPLESIVLTGILDKTVDHGITAIDTFTVTNNGNEDIDSIVFEVTDLADGTGRFIASSRITFSPTFIDTLGIDSSRAVEVFVAVPLGTYDTTYTGTVTVRDNDGFPLEMIAINITVNPSYDLDIDDDGQNLVGNIMSLVGGTDSVVTASFVLVNPNSDAQNVDPDPFGNANLDLSGPNAYVSTDLMFGTDTIPSDSISFSGTPTTLASGSFANVGVSVSIPAAQQIGTYTGTVTVTSADGSMDNFTLNVTVGQTESIVLTGILDKTVDHGITATDTFTVTNDGNVIIDSIVLEVTDLVDGAGRFIASSSITFNPTFIDTLGIGLSQDVEVFVAVPLGTYDTTYTGTVTVKDDDGFPLETIAISITVNPSYDLDIDNNGQDLVGDTMSLVGNMGSVVAGTFVLVNPNSAVQNVDPDPFGNADIDLSGPNAYVSTDLIFGTDTIPAIAILFLGAPDTLASGDSANIGVSVSIPGGQQEGTYTGTVTVTSLDGSTDNFTLNVTVNPLESIVLTGILDKTVDHGITAIDTFTVANNGNADIDSIVFEVTNLVDGAGRFIASSSITFSPTFIDTLGIGLSQDVEVFVAVPLGTYDTTYTGTVTVKDNDGFPLETIAISITVNPSYDLDIDDNGQNLVGNMMSLVGDTGSVVAGSFVLVNPNSAVQNVDPDPFGNADIDLSAPNAYVSTDLIFGTDTIPAIAILFLGAPDTLASGDSANIGVSVSIPGGQEGGTYTGTVTVTSADGSTDNFTLNVTVTVGPGESIALTGILDKTVDHGITAIDTFAVVNNGAVLIDSIIFSVTDLADGTGRFIASSSITFNPTSIDTLGIGFSQDVEVHVAVPFGTYHTTYTGIVTVKDDDGFPLETIAISITVNPSYDLDIADNAHNLVGNTMSLTGAMGSVVAGSFVLVNPNRDAQNVDPDPFGNADLDLSGTNAYVSTDLIVGTDTIPSDSISFSGTPTTLASGTLANVGLSVSIPDGQREGTYTGMVTVTSADGSMDNFTLNVTVGPVEIIVLTGMLDKTVDHGITAIDTFTVTNNGNVDIDNVVFEVTDLADGTGRFIASSSITFNPTSIGVLGMGLSQGVEVFVAVPLGTYNTTYTGTVTVRDDDGFPFETIAISITVNPSYDLDIADNAHNLVGNTMSLTGAMGSVVAGSFVLVNPNRDAQNVDLDPFGNADLDLSGPGAYVSTNLISGTDTIPSDSISFSGYPTILVSGTLANVGLSVSIPDGQRGGTYTGMVTVTSADGSTDNFTLNVTVGPVEGIVLTGILDKTVDHGITAIDTFTVINNGNVDIDNVVFEVPDLADGTGRFIASSYITFNPTSIGILEIGLSQEVEVHVEVPLGTYNTTYTGTVTVRDDDGFPFETIAISITVSPSYDLDIDDNGQNLVHNMMSLVGDTGSVVAGSFVLVNPNSEAQNVDPDPFGNADLVNLTYILSDLTGPGANIVPDAIVTPTTLASGDFANVIVSVSIPGGQQEGTYTGTVTVTSLDGSTDNFVLNVTVGPGESIALTGILDKTVDHGITAIDTFTVANNGAMNIDNIVFEVPDLADGTGRFIASSYITFNPTSIGILGTGLSQDVEVFVNVPLGTYNTTYTGTVTVKDDDGFPFETIAISITVNPSYDLDIDDNGQTLVGNMMSLTGGMGSVVAGSFVLVNPNSAVQNVDPDPFGNTDLDLSGSDAYVSMNLISGTDTIPSDSISFSGAPTTLASGTMANVGLSVSIPDGQEGGTYTGMVTVTSADGSTDNFTLNVTVTFDPGESIVLSGILDKTVDHGITAIDTFTVTNDGNVIIDNIIFGVTDLADGTGRFIASSYITFNPTSIGILGTGLSQNVEVFVNVPLGTYNTTYTGTVTVKDDDGFPLETIAISITVNPSYDLDIDDNGQDLVGNMLSLTGDMSSVVAGIFVMVNPNSDVQNVDPDPFGNADLATFSYISDTLLFVGKSGKATMSHGVVDYDDPFVVRKGGKIGEIIPAEYVTVALPVFIASGSGEDVTISVEIPQDIRAGTYEGWVSFTGEGVTTDRFKLQVQVMTIEDIDIAEGSVTIVDEVEHGSTAQTPDFTVVNTDSANNPDIVDGPGNVTLYGINFTADNLISIDGTKSIPENNISFEPKNINSIASGISVSTYAVIHIPTGTYATTYTGLVTAQNDGGSVSDTVRIILTIADAPFFYIPDDQGHLVGNTISLIGDVGTRTGRGQFVLRNIGNVGITGITYTVTGLDQFTIEFDQAEYSVEYGGRTVGDLFVTIPDGQTQGTYIGWVVLKHPSGVRDSFNLSITVKSAALVSLSVDTLYITGREGRTARDTFSVSNQGNVDLTLLMLEMIEYLEGGGTLLLSDKVTFTPTVIDVLAIDDTTDVVMSVEIPRFTMAGEYIGEFMVGKEGGPLDMAVVVLTVISETEIAVDRNPVIGDKVNISVKADDDFEPKLTILNLAGEIVRFKEAFAAPVGKSGVTTRVYEWRLDNPAGKKVAPGMYIILIQTRIDGKEKVLRDKILVIR